MKYQEIIDSAQIRLRDSEAANWSEVELLDLLNDGVRIVGIILGNINPEDIWETDTISLTTVIGYGPYNLPATTERVVHIFDDQGKEIRKTSRLKEHRTVSAQGRPRGFWLEGKGPIKLYFDMTTEIDRDFELYYLPAIARTDNPADDIPLPDVLYEIMVQWLVKFAADIDEYNTQTEADLISAMTPFVLSVIDSRSGEVEFSMEGLGW